MNRRNFLRCLSLGTAGIAATGITLRVKQPLNSEESTLKSSLHSDTPNEFILEAAEFIREGDLLALDEHGRVRKADNRRDCIIIGIATSQAKTREIIVISAMGSTINIPCEGNPPPGTTVYLGYQGKTTSVQPATLGCHVTQVGMVLKTDKGSSRIVFHPQHLGSIPKHYRG
jgi:hypothetical protein